MARNGNVECKVYIGDLSEGTSEKELEREFEKFGRLKSVWVARNPPGFAFVEFEDVRDAEDAVKDMDGREICHRRVRVEHASGRSKPKPWRGGGDRGGRGPPRYDNYRDNYRGGGYRDDFRDNRGGGRRGFSNDDKCYECGERGHYAYDCRNRGGGGGYNSGRRGRERSRSGSRNRVRSYSRSRSRSGSQGRANARSSSRSPV